MKVAVFDDVIFLRGETFAGDGLAVDVYAHADDAVLLAQSEGYTHIFMDYEMGTEHDNGVQAVTKLRAGGFEGKLVAISSDPKRNEEMVGAGADESLPKKSFLPSYLASLLHS